MHITLTFNPWVSIILPVVKQKLFTAYSIIHTFFLVESADKVSF